MTVMEAVILGVIQGITEFLPVSSSGHLVLAQSLIGVDEQGVALEVAVHIATLFAILVYYRRTLATLILHLAGRETEPGDRNKALRFTGFLILASVPAGGIGILLKSSVEAAFESPALASVMLMATGVFLLSTRFISNQSPRPVGWGRAFLIGCAQAAAILPGVSRSGSTVGTALWCGVEGKEAAEFSFLLACPAIAGAGLITFLGADDLQVHVPTLAVAFTASLVTGFASLVLLIKILERRRLHWFGPYCLAAGGAFLIWFLAAA